MKRKEKVWRPWCSEITSLDDAVASIGEPGDERTDSLQYGGGEVSRRKRRWISPEKSGVCRRFKDYRPAGKTPFTRMIISWDTVRLWIYVSRITLSFCVMFQRGCSYRHFVRLWLSFCGSKVVILWIYRCHLAEIYRAQIRKEFLIFCDHHTRRVLILFSPFVGCFFDM